MKPTRQVIHTSYKDGQGHRMWLASVDGEIVGDETEHLTSRELTDFLKDM